MSPQTEADGMQPVRPARARVCLQSLALGTGALLVSLLAGIQISSGWQSTLMPPTAQTATPIRNAIPDAVPASTPSPVEELLVEVLPGDTLENLFRDQGLSTVDLAEILQLTEAREYLGVLRPGDVLRVRHDAGKVIGLSRELDLRRNLAIIRSETGFTAAVAELPIESRIVMARGRIDSSLFEAAQDANVSERLIMNIAEVFEYDIDFVRDIGEDDEFSVVYEELWRDGSKLGEGDVLAAEFVNRGARYTAIRFADVNGKPEYYTHDGQPMRKAFLRAPLSFTRISSDFNPRRRHPILNKIRAHQGVDYAAPKGTPVKASGDGKIIFRGWKGGYGNTLIVQHGGNVTTLYGHLSRFGKYSYGGRVRQGDVIGYVGATGLATAPHLHYEYRKHGVHLNPRTVVLPNAEPLRGHQLTAFLAVADPLLKRLEGRGAMLAANRPAP
jgi:murein DD-endopeptidase MepM/ murein hydrolase activator NlpD